MPRTYHGSKTPTVQFESGEWSYSYSESIWVQIRNGGKQEILTSLPGLGPLSTIAGCPIANAFVVDVKTKALNKAYWQSVVICAGPPNAVLEEIERGLITRKIEYHPRYRGSGSGGPVPLKELWAIEAAIGASDEASFNQIAGNPVGTGGKITTSLGLELLGKRMRGQDSYLEPAPIARRTRYFALTTAGPTGILQTPTFIYTGLPTGYQWLKTADRVMNRPGFLERIEEWQAAISWDSDLYS